MTKGFYLKLAAGNIKKNGKTYLPYIITCILTVAAYYIVKSLSVNPGLKKMIGNAAVSYLLSFGSWVVAVFALIFLFYTNSFLMKRRKKEFGVFHILGMEKKHLAVVLSWENIYVTFISLALGLGIGIALDKVMFLVITKLIEAEVPLGFFISIEAVGMTALLFAVIFLLIFLYSVRQIYKSNPIELLHAGNAGEKEPKTKWFMALLGILSLGAGYYIAVTTEDVMKSILVFFIAVLFVIAGTYLLFTAGSIALLKTLRRNKRYYYKTRHFTSISGMIYRMKQNAVGLANICILSTMVLVMVSSTTSLMFGMEDVIKARYPADFAVYVNEEEGKGEKAIEAVQSLQKEQHLHVAKEIQYTYLSFSVYCDADDFQIISRNDSIHIAKTDSVQILCFVPLSDYNALMGEHKTLENGEAMIYSNRQSFGYPSFHLLGQEYKITEELDDFAGNGELDANIASTHFVIVPGMEEIRALSDKLQEVSQGTQPIGGIKQFYGFDSDAGREEQIAFYYAASGLFKGQSHEYSGRLESAAEARQGFIGLYGGFFFLGVFLGLLFTMAAVLIIYYKQISEGYDDKERFAIMQKVGMSHDEVKASIHSQILTVFFLPLIMAGIHVAAAVPMILKQLMIFNMYNTKLYIACTAACFLIFAVVYVLIYAVTARTYYRIVSC